MRDRVTVSLYSVEMNDPPGYNRGFLDQFSNIEKIYRGLVDAAAKSGQPPPEFVVSILLIPDWKRKNNSYTDESYLKRKSAFLESAKEKTQEMQDVKIENFYLDGKMLDEHKAYLHELRALGSNADMIKTMAIINNEGRKHLQIDSNTIVISFEELYNQTFGAYEQKDGINASFYDEDYISAHNKMVYAASDSKLANFLFRELWRWCRKHQNDLDDKQSSKNSIYSKVFAVALHELGYVGKFMARGDKILYPATLSDKVYWLTDCMVTAINMSWSVNRGEDISKELKKLPAIKIGPDGLFDFQCFSNVVKKYIGDLSRHSIMLGLNDKTETGEKSRELLFNVSNALERQAVKQFFDHVYQNYPQHIFQLSTFISDTSLGNQFSGKIFGCTVKELHEQSRARSVNESEVAQEKLPASPRP